MTARRKYPIGIQTFSEIITKGYLYIDKTHLMWQLVNVSKYIFLSRPRRFGKSLLASTLESYFRADKHLFEGLKIMQLETEWQPHPVIHLDLSLAKNQASTQRLEEKLYYILEPYVSLYGKSPLETTPGSLFHGLITRAFQQSGQQVAVIIDEYDAPLLDTLHAGPLLSEFRRVMQDLFQPLKACEPMIHSCFITGITKFSQLSIFSTINNISNVTLDPAFATICGITQQEVDDNMPDDVEHLAATYGCSPTEMRGRLQETYDGYHFSESSPGVYNPFSLMKAFNQQKLGNYWFESGTPTFLLRQMRHYKTDITQLDMQQVSAEAFDQPTEGMRDALPLLYQSGYLTIKGFDPDSQLYTLDFPNAEVKVGFLENLYVHRSQDRPREGRRGGVHERRHLRNGDQDQRHGPRGIGADRHEKLRRTLRGHRPTRGEDRHRLLERNQDGERVENRLKEFNDSADDKVKPKQNQPPADNPVHDANAFRVEELFQERSALGLQEVTA